jgi:hypothetical protein
MARVLKQMVDEIWEQAEKSSGKTIEHYFNIFNQSCDYYINGNYCFTSYEYW